MWQLRVNYSRSAPSVPMRKWTGQLTASADRDSGSASAVSTLFSVQRDTTDTWGSEETACNGAHRQPTKMQRSRPKSVSDMLGPSAAQLLKKQTPLSI